MKKKKTGKTEVRRREKSQKIKTEGDWNRKIGTDRTGRHEKKQRNRNGTIFARVYLIRCFDDFWLEIKGRKVILNEISVSG